MDDLKSNNKRWQFWIDRGGTFTDVVARKPDGSIVSKKLLSQNPEQYADAAIYGIRQILELQTNEKIPSHQIESVKMGTTVATNALLEHKGEPTILVITKGFAEALRIGYQNRPNIFAKHIILPQVIYSDVIEVDERVNVKGEVIAPLKINPLEKELVLRFQNGYRSLAIVLMHSYQFHEHEKAIAELATKIGFTQISASFKVSPLMRIVSRGDTTVIDAYLSPTLKTYIEKVSNELDGINLYFMQSNGGLADANAFHGKDSILSGPAAGVIGAIETASIAGFNKIISFDMGGTSTDVAHYCGELERSQLAIIAGVRLRSPMLKIHTIAAGGGSIVKFHQGRFQVGPESAGADPGPACYRRGGPLTLTDCNLLLGRIHPDYFPNIFGSQYNKKLDKTIVEKKFLELGKHIFAETNEQKSIQEIAEGFFKIAVNNMANAIKKISVQKGYDVTQYTLCCFGGAGGQHACAVADELGIKKIMIHPLAGVLSAYGMGLAKFRILKEQTVEKELKFSESNEIKTIISKLSAAGISEMSQQGIPEERISKRCKLRLRYQGSDTSIGILYAPIAEMKLQFEKRHQAEFGYVMSENKIVIESILIEIIGRTEHHNVQFNLNEATDRSPVANKKLELFFQGKCIPFRLFQRELLNSGDRIDGPAAIIDVNSTTIIEPNWQAKITHENNLIVEKIIEKKQKQDLSKAADPIMLEVFNNLFMSIAEQMGTVLGNTAYSVNIKERRDFSCAIFDIQGDLIANAPHIPVHLGSMWESIQVIIKERHGKMQPGDAYLLNNPYNGGTHLPDVTVITPIFYQNEKRPMFYVASRAHQADIGGITPGSIPATSRHIDEEGVLIDNFLLVDQGVFREQALYDLLTKAKWPVRNPKQNITDIKAQIAANQMGMRELFRAIDQFGIEVVQAYMQHVQDNAEHCVRQVIDQLNSGNFCYSMDNAAKICVKIEVDNNKRSATIDFTGTSPQQDNNFNAPKAVCYAAVLYVFRTLVNESIPLNQGSLKPLNIIIPEGCLLNPTYPAAIVAGNVETSQCIVDTLYGALQVMAASQGTMNNFTFGNDQYQYYETICGGSGAGDGFDGTSAVHTHMTNSLLTDPEILEFRFPVMVNDFKIRQHSGGKGKWRGGDGVIRKIEFLEPMTAAIVSNHRKIPPYGLAGGESGKVGKNWIARNNGKQEILASTAQFEVHPGDIVVIETPGGGGYGER